VHGHQRPPARWACPPLGCGPPSRQVSHTESIAHLVDQPPYDAAEATVCSGLSPAQLPTQHHACCLHDSRASSTACWRVLSLQVRSDGSSSQCAPVRSSDARWSVQRNDRPVVPVASRQGATVAEPPTSRKANTSGAEGGRHPHSSTERRYAGVCTIRRASQAGGRGGAVHLSAARVPAGAPAEGGSQGRMTPDWRRRRRVRWSSRAGR
jgi:hypothetical protein